MIGCLEGTGALDKLGDDSNYLYSVTPWAPSDKIHGNHYYLFDNSYMMLVMKRMKKLTK